MTRITALAAARIHHGGDNGTPKDDLFASSHRLRSALASRARASNRFSSSSDTASTT
ncbi:hypothetical protein [Bifidobacterium phasiani]|uniref:Uncharacterized protein n=1 Tax=Bifidobacterium phasiani TaxID=2834431 RepID=A0ABS6WBC3_9BIFI|nr:hypothetical protein [Bifidobacterium phasiani]MBW3083813.1 hypothetical protein [Bifidobacterium phasiani]